MIRKLTMFLAPEGGEGGEGGAGGTGDTGNADGAEKQLKSMTGEEPAKSRSITDEGKTGETGGKPEGEKPTADLKLKLPEGMDEKAAEPHLAIFKKHGLKPEVAQEIFDHVLKHGVDSRSAFEKEIRDFAAKAKAAQLDEARKDPEIGGDKFKESVALADKFVLRFGGDALMDALIKSGLGTNVAVIKAFAKAGASISEDSIGGTTGSTGKGGGKLSKKAELQRDFPNSPGMWEHLPD